jgi:hypothetical protein
MKTQKINLTAQKQKKCKHLNCFITEIIIHKGYREDKIINTVSIVENNIEQVICTSCYKILKNFNIEFN